MKKKIKMNEIFDSYFFQITKWALLIVAYSLSKYIAHLFYPNSLL